jgi:hypothetical protein
MALSISITARKIFTRLEKITNAKLNALGLPTLSLSGTADTSQITNSAVTAVKGAYGPWFYCTDGGTANAHSLTAAASGTVLPTSLVAGQIYRYTAAATNTSATVTVAVSGIAGTKNLTKQGAAALAIGDVRSGQALQVLYDGTQFQIQNASGQPDFERYATTGGSVTAYTATFTPTLTALINGVRVCVKWNGTNTTATPTFQADSTTAKTMVKLGGAALGVGDLVTDQVNGLVYDSTLDKWVVQGMVSAVASRVAVRQTVLTCSVASTGLPQFLTYSGQNISFQNTSTSAPVRMAFGAGSDSNGQVDYVGSVESNVNNAWTISTSNGTYYLYVDRNTSTGALTYDETTLAPVYSNGASASVTSGQHTYLINEGKMYVGDGAAASAVQRVFVGECVVSGGAITSVTAYMPMGRFQSGSDQTIAANNTDQTWSETHQLGLTPRDVRWVLVCQTADLNYVAGDEVEADQLIRTDTAQGTKFLGKRTTSSVTSFLAGWGTSTTVGGLINRTTYNYTTGITAANWKMRCYAWRGW